MAVDELVLKTTLALLRAGDVLVVHGNVRAGKAQRQVDGHSERAVAELGKVAADRNDVDMLARCMDHARNAFARREENSAASVAQSTVVVAVGYAGTLSHRQYLFGFAVHPNLLVVRTEHVVLSEMHLERGVVG